MEAGKEKGLRGLQQHHQCSATSIVARQATEQPTSDLPLEPRDGSTVVHMRVEGLRSVKRKYEKKNDDIMVTLGLKNQKNNCGTSLEI